MHIEPGETGAGNPRSGWARAAHEALVGEGIRLVSTVPDGGLADLLRRCGSDPSMRVVTLTSEEEGVALATGAWLGGTRAVLLMQSSGVGNCVNALTLPSTCGVPCLMVVTMRGEWGEFNPWQVPMARAAPTVLEAMDVTLFRPRYEDEIGPHVRSAGRFAFNTGRSAAVLIAQEILGSKDFGLAADRP